MISTPSLRKTSSNARVSLLWQVSNLRPGGAGALHHRGASCLQVTALVVARERRAFLCAPLTSRMLVFADSGGPVGSRSTGTPAIPTGLPPGVRPGSKRDGCRTFRDVCHSRYRCTNASCCGIHARVNPSTTNSTAMLTIRRASGAGEMRIRGCSLTYGRVLIGHNCDSLNESEKERFGETGHEGEERGRGP
jgi:hypothetical protein